MGYSLRGYSPTSVSALRVAGDVTITGNVTAARHLASSLGTAGAPAFAATGATDGGLYWVNAAIAALSAGGVTWAYGTATQAVLNLPAKCESFLDLAQITAPAAPAATVARLYSVDSGATKNRIAAIFDTGAQQTVATEP